MDSNTISSCMMKQLQPRVSFETLEGHWSSAARRLGWKGMSSSKPFVPVWEMPGKCQPMHGDISAIPVLTHNLPGF